MQSWNWGMHRTMRIRTSLRQSWGQFDRPTKELKRVQEAHEAELEHAWQAHEEELERTWVAHENSGQELTQKVSQLEGRVTEERERYKALWHLNCTQLAEYDEMIACKEEEIQTLKEKINGLEAHLGNPLLLETGHGGYVNMSAPSHTECTMRGVTREAVVPVSHPGCGPAHTPPVASPGGRPPRLSLTALPSVA